MIIRGPNIVPPLKGFLSSMVVVRKWSQAMNGASNNAYFTLILRSFPGMIPTILPISHCCGGRFIS